MATALRDFIGSLTAELAGDGAPLTRFRIAAFGKNETTKGTFELRPADAKAMVDRAKRRGIKLAADYEHASVHAAARGTEAPAAAWYELECGDDGLYATNVEWTPRALERLKGKEYRYHSPWFGQREDGSVATFKNFALTNRPAMDALTPLVASEDASEDDEALPPEKPKMKTLFKQLALSEDATEAEVLTKVQALAAERDAFFTATGTKDIPSALAALETARVGAAKAEKLQAELDTFTKAAAAKERELLLSEAIASGAIPPNMKEFWASETMTVEQLRAYVAKAPKVGKPAAGTLVKEKDVAEVDLALTEEDKAVAKALDITEEKFSAQKKLTLGRV